MAGSILGTRVLRTEDPALLTGSARYLNDLDLPGKLHAVFARSEVAHARLGTVHIDDAAATPGVVAVFTGRRPRRRAAPRLRHRPPRLRPPAAGRRRRALRRRGHRRRRRRDRRRGRRRRRRGVGRLRAARRRSSTRRRRSPTAPPVIFPDHGIEPGARRHRPDPVDLEAISDVVVRGRYVNQRIAVVPMETERLRRRARRRRPAARSTPRPRCPTACTASSPRPSASTAPTSASICPQVGGGFGGKAGICAEYSRRRRRGPPPRPAGRRGRRRAATTSSSLPHSRGQIQYAELGCRRDGTFTGLRVHLVGDGGAYPGIGAFLPAGTKRMSNGTYRFPAIQFDVAVAVTNTTPMGAYRGAGRPEATALLERLVDHAAHELGIDPIELRRRNLLADDVFPFTTLTGVTYDTGRYATPLDAAAEAIGYDELRARAGRAPRARRPARRSASASPPTSRSPPAAAPASSAPSRSTTTARPRCGPARSPTARATRRRSPCSSTTRPASRSTASASSTATPTSCPRAAAPAGRARCSSAARPCTRPPRRSSSKAKRLAAHLLEADVADIVVDTDAGTVGVAGVPAGALTWAELAAGRRGPTTCSATATPGVLAADGDFDQGDATFPFGAHIAVVEVDLDTGRVARRCATSPSTTAARCSTRCSSRASSTAASPPASARRCTRRSATTPTATR